MALPLIPIALGTGLMFILLTSGGKKDPTPPNNGGKDDPVPLPPNVPSLTFTNQDTCSGWRFNAAWVTRVADVRMEKYLATGQASNDIRNADPADLPIYAEIITFRILDGQIPSSCKIPKEGEVNYLQTENPDSPSNYYPYPSVLRLYRNIMEGVMAALESYRSGGSASLTFATMQDTDMAPKPPSQEWDCPAAVKALIGSSGFVPTMKLRSELKALAPSKFSLSPIDFAAEQLAAAALLKLYPGCSYSAGFDVLNKGEPITVSSAAILSGTRDYAMRELLDAGYGEGWACPEATNDLVNPAGIFNPTNDLLSALEADAPNKKTVSPIDTAAERLAIEALSRLYPRCMWVQGYNALNKDLALEPKSEKVLIGARDYAMRALLDAGYQP